MAETLLTVEHLIKKYGDQVILGGAKRQNGFCDITREHPSEILNIFNIRAKVSRDVIFTLQKKLFENDSDERL